MKERKRKRNGKQVSEKERKKERNIKHKERK